MFAPTPYYSAPMFREIPHLGFQRNGGFIDPYFNAPMTSITAGVSKGKKKPRKVLPKKTPAVLAKSRSHSRSVTKKASKSKSKSRSASKKPAVVPKKKRAPKAKVQKLTYSDLRKAIQDKNKGDRTAFNRVMSRYVPIATD